RPALSRLSYVPCAIRHRAAAGVAWRPQLGSGSRRFEPVSAYHGGESDGEIDDVRLVLDEASGGHGPRQLHGQEDGLEGPCGRVDSHDITWTDACGIQRS